MAFNPAPTSVIPNIRLDSNTELVIPLADLNQELTAVEADPATGDWREILFSILDQFTHHYINLPAADKPTKVVLEKRGTLLADNEYRYTYTININTLVTGEDVPPEP